MCKRTQLLLLKLSFFQSFQICILTEGKPPDSEQTIKFVDEKNQGELGARPAVGLLSCPQSDFFSLQQLDMSLSALRLVLTAGGKPFPHPLLSPTEESVLNLSNVCEREKKKTKTVFTVSKLILDY